VALKRLAHSLSDSATKGSISNWMGFFVVAIYEPANPRAAAVIITSASTAGSPSFVTIPFVLRNGIAAPYVTEDEQHEHPPAAIAAALGSLHGT
jgi:hypothetical protein